MYISWCQVQSYRYGTYGGWISDTYMGMARVQCWFFSLLQKLPTPTPYEPPTEAIHKWDKEQCTSWMKVKGIKFGSKC